MAGSAANKRVFIEKKRDEGSGFLPCAQKEKREGNFARKKPPLTEKDKMQSKGCLSW